MLRHLTIVHPNMHRIIGGSERLMADLAIGFSRMNIHVQMVTGVCHPSWLSEFASSGVNIAVTQLGKPALGSYRFWLRMDNFAQELARHIERDTEIVVASGFPSHHAAHIFGRTHNKSYICYLHDAPSTLHDRQGIRILPMHHKVFYELLSSSHRKPDIDGVRASRLVIANSKLTRHASSQVYGIEENKIQVIYPGISTERLAKSTKQTLDICDRIKDRSPIVYFPNGVQRWRNPDLALRALRRIADESWMAIFTGGSVSEARHFDREKTRLGLTGIVKRMSELTSSEIPVIYRNSDVVISVPLREPFGLIPAEALACGAPVIATRNSGISEILRDGEHILCVDPGNVEQLIGGITRLLHNEEWTRNMVECGRRKVLKCLTIDRYVQAMYSMLESLVKP